MRSLATSSSATMRSKRAGPMSRRIKATWARTSTATTGFNLFTYLPTALLNYPGDVLGLPSSVAALQAVGFNPQSQPLWAYHWGIYWGLTQKIYRLEFDPEYTGYTCSDMLGAGPSCVSPPALTVPPTDPDALYHYRP